MGTALVDDDHGDFVVRSLELSDIDEFIGLQDKFAQDHLEFTQPIYSKVSFRDWQLSLLCPAHILEESGGRERHVASMVKRDDECFHGLHILKALTKPAGSGEQGALAGYIMFQVHEEKRIKRKGPGRRRANARGATTVGPWSQVKQIFVRCDMRKRGCGKLLLTSMYRALGPREQQDVRLCVLDLNAAATQWYRSCGFVVTGLSLDRVGEREDYHVIVYQEMSLRKDADETVPMSIPTLFRGEVIREVIRIDYPDQSGVFDVRIVGYDEKERWHYVDSRGLSLWDGECYTDVVNLNEFYVQGHVSFKRHLSLIHRDVELSKREARRAKAVEARAKSAAQKRQLEGGLLDEPPSQIKRR